MKNNILYFLIFLTSAFIGNAQVEEQELDSIAEQMIIVAGDSLIQSSIALEEAYVFGKLKFSSYDDKLRYYILRRKTEKVYPYAKMAAERLVELNDSLVYMKNNRKRKKYTKKVQKFIEEEFSEELKKLTRTEGQILVKLIYRQTGTTAFDLVKDLRNGWRAFWYNTTAKLFSISIKEEFHPDLIEEDYLIEDILQRAFSKGTLERQATVLDYDYDALYNKWKKTTEIPKQ
ncbi:DUF4294 domain-containing protein [Maribacter hydrothermalis]|uniref:DUF4294 domain-containing protein n=1 Tax=Maribacter hydrothermalis TaxID=1836467 RepID=A0A1B7Z913_9FLAO|nr:DUF4294 domain-containing protein [Maribacter hydrothermalis]APQ19187.1 hypothetical protein BTR34_00090 [Maribacter hydrothermalis]OBR39185.1 hypothetical protein A9200_03720 [Maribacter hydrothermalis]